MPLNLCKLVVSLHKNLLEPNSISYELKMSFNMNSFSGALNLFVFILSVVSLRNSGSPVDNIYYFDDELGDLRR